MSVVVPTCARPAFLARALSALRRQRLTDWEVVVVDDGPSAAEQHDTLAVLLASGIADPRYLRNPANRGPGCALNTGLAAACGRYVAFLPDDDVIDPDHLDTCVRLLESRPGLSGAFGGVRWYPDTTLNAGPPRSSALLREDLHPARLGRCADDPPGGSPEWVVPSGNFLALVQVVLRRPVATSVRFSERTEIVTDTLEYDYWRALLATGAELAHTGSVTCEWTDHPGQHHKIISGRGRSTRDWRSQSYGVTVYRQHYRVPAGTPLNWQPSRGGLPMDERARYRRTGGAVPTTHPGASGGTSRPDRLRILVAGSLGFHPDRISALVDAGHEVFGSWLPGAPFWDTAGPLPFPGVVDVPFDADWPARIAAIRPAVVWGQLNWAAVPFLAAVHRRCQPLGVPFVLHFKESPQLAVRAGYWAELARLLADADGRIIASAAEREWLEHALGTALPAATTMVFDGEYPLREVFTDDWQPRLSDLDGRLHTVCVGRTILEPVAELADAGIEVHVYPLPYMRAGSRWVGDSGAPNVHVHPPVPPARWVGEFSRYDAGWAHLVRGGNHGDIGRATWPELNLPARLSSYAAAGLPWIQRRNAGHRVASRELADELGVGLHYDDIGHLALLLKREQHTRAGARAMRAQRVRFCFDEHVGALADFFRRCGRSVDG